MAKKFGAATAIFLLLVVVAGSSTASWQDSQSNLVNHAAYVLTDANSACRGHLKIEEIGSEGDDIHATLYGNADGWCVEYFVTDARPEGVDSSTVVAATRVMGANDAQAWDGSDGACSDGTCTHQATGTDGIFMGIWPETGGQMLWHFGASRTDVTVQTTLEKFEVKTYSSEHDVCINQEPAAVDVDTSRGDPLEIVSHDIAGGSTTAGPIALAIVGIAVSVAATAAGLAASTYLYCTGMTTKDSWEEKEEIITDHVPIDDASRAFRLDATASVSVGNGDFYGEDTYDEFENLHGPYDTGTIMDIRSTVTRHLEGEGDFSWDIHRLFAVENEDDENVDTRWRRSDLQLDYFVPEEAAHIDDLESYHRFDGHFDWEAPAPPIDVYEGLRLIGDTVEANIFCNPSMVTYPSYCGSWGIALCYPMLAAGIDAGFDESNPDGNDCNIMICPDEGWSPADWATGVQNNWHHWPNAGRDGSPTGIDSCMDEPCDDKDSINTGRDGLEYTYCSLLAYEATAISYFFGTEVVDSDSINVPVDFRIDPCPPNTSYQQPGSIGQPPSHPVGHSSCSPLY